MPYIQRNENGEIVGKYEMPQPGYAEEYLPEDSEELKERDLKNAKKLKKEDVAKEKERRLFHNWTHSMVHGVTTRAQNIQGRIIAALASGESYVMNNEEKNTMNESEKIERTVKSIDRKAADLEASIDAMTKDDIASFNARDDRHWEEK